jgi:hypothetical protein
MQPEILFISELRNYVSHHRLPIAGHQFSFIANEPFHFKIYALKEELLLWKSWPSNVESYLKSSDPLIDLGRLLLSHMNEARVQWDWLQSMKERVHVIDLFLYNELVTEGNWALSGCVSNIRGKFVYQ